MQNNLFALFSELDIAESGHYKMESGFHSDLWLHLDKLLQHRDRLTPFITNLSEKFKIYNIDFVCGPQTGGAQLAEVIAYKMDKKYIYSDRIVNPNDNTVIYKVPEKIYESIKGKRVAVVDDVIQAGSAIKKTIADLEKHDATIVVIGALLTLGPSASIYAKEKGFGLESIAHKDNQLWSPQECPLCAIHQPLDRSI